jgi:hypothetical protein
MKIADASIQSSSMHKIEANREVSEKLEIFSGGSSADEPAYVLEIGSDRAIATQKTYLCCDQDHSEDEDTQIKLKLLEDFIYQLTGRQVKLRSPKVRINSGSAEAAAASAAKELRVARQRDGWGLIYEYKELTKESESIKFSAAGTVTTSDGRTVEFSVQFLMSREYIREHYVNVSGGSAVKVDPLVVVFGNGAPMLSRIKESFDLNGDGNPDQISFAIENSGFLALDKNEDGEINDGSELFGPATGNGFSELRAYDIDGNGWIDEADDVFGKLSVLTMSKDGREMTFKLGELGIGAIYLNDIETAFGIKDEAGEYGEMRSSSVYLKEDGTPGTIHHIDLVI